jgi:radical SAM-linked protein
MQRPAPSGPPPAPVAQRMTVRYAKRGPMRFASHRDVARAIERGVRMAGLPVAYSAGFSPHPKISYAGAAPTGTASEAEYLELGLTGEYDPGDLRDRLSAALPRGIDIVAVSVVGDGSQPEQLEASAWQVECPGVSDEAAATAVAAFLAAEHIEVERLTNKGIRRFDARAAVLSLTPQRRAGAGQDAGCAILRMVVRHMTPAVRPDDILAALGQVADLAPTSPPLVTRLAQGPIGWAAAAARTGEPGTPGLADPVAVQLSPSSPSAGQGQEKATCLEAEAPQW